MIGETRTLRRAIAGRSLVRAYDMCWRQRGAKSPPQCNL